MANKASLSVRPLAAVERELAAGSPANASRRTKKSLLVIAILISFQIALAVVSFVRPHDHFRAIDGTEIEGRYLGLHKGSITYLWLAKGWGWNIAPTSPQILLPGIDRFSQPGVFNYVRVHLLWPLGATAICSIRPIFVLRRRKRIARRIAAGRCAKCGYDLRSCETTCPECGEAIDDAMVAQLERLRRPREAAAAPAPTEC